MELGITVYQVILLVVGYFAALWGVVKYVLARQNDEDKLMSERLESNYDFLSKKIEEIKEDYIRREEFEREMNRFNSSLTSVRDEVVGSNAAQAQSMQMLSTRIDSWMQSYIKKD